MGDLRTALHRSDQRIAMLESRIRKLESLVRDLDACCTGYRFDGERCQCEGRCVIDADERMRELGLEVRR